MFLLPNIPQFGLNLYKEQRMLEFVKTVLPQFDIICCQEVFYTFNARKDQLINYAQLSGYPYSAKSPKPGLFSVKSTDAGLLTLSRFPIIQSEFRSYSNGVFSDSISDKGVLYTQIMIGSQIIHLFNTHMQASYISTNIQEIKASIDTR